MLFVGALVFDDALLALFLVCVAFSDCKDHATAAFDDIALAGSIEWNLVE